MNDVPKTSDDGRVYGFVIAGASLLSILAMGYHPTLGGHDLRASLQEAVREGPVGAGVHGFLMVTSGALLFGLRGFSERLDRSLWAEAGLIAWAIGTFAMFCAMAASGFMVPRIAAAYVDADPAGLEIARGLLRFVWATNQTWDRVGTVAFSIGILCWSAAMLSRGGGLRWVGIGGILSALGCALAVVGGLVVFDAHGMLLVLVAQTVWTLAVAGFLIRRRI